MVLGSEGLMSSEQSCRSKRWTQEQRTGKMGSRGEAIPGRNARIRDSNCGSRKVLLSPLASHPRESCSMYAVRPESGQLPHARVSTLSPQQPRRPGTRLSPCSGSESGSFLSLLSPWTTLTNDTCVISFHLPSYRILLTNLNVVDTEESNFPKVPEVTHDRSKIQAQIFALPPGFIHTLRLAGASLIKPEDVFLHHSGCSVQITKITALSWQLSYHGVLLTFYLILTTTLHGIYY